MDHKLSRRKFIGQATVAGTATLLEAAGGVPANSAELPKHPEGAAVLNAVAAPPTPRSYEDVVHLPIYKVHIEPNWFAGGSRFWYRNDGPGGSREFILVDAAKGARGPAFDAAKVAAALSQASGTVCTADHLPFESIGFTDGLKSVYFHADAREWQVDLATYVCTEGRPAGAAAEPAANAGGRGRNGRQQRRRQANPEANLSPDGKWEAFVRDHNVWIRVVSSEAETQITHDGSQDHRYGDLVWSPNSRKIAGFRINPVVVAPVYMLESTPKAGGTRGVLHQHDYAQAGDPFPTHEPWIFDPVAITATAASVDPVNWGEEPPEIHWRADSSAFLYEKTDVGHQRFRIIAVDARTFQPLVILDERTETFINTSNSFTWYSADCSEIIYVSEKDGWRHIYRYDAVKGGLRNQITSGAWVVRGPIDHVDEKAQQIWFQGSGRNPGENPYHIHFYRVNFDGTGLIALTDGDGTHAIQHSPDNTYLIDTWSRVDLPPVHTLRKSVDGSHLCDLEKSDISTLTDAGWRTPERFTARGRDEKTDIWGIVFRPLNFDPGKRYPVIENIYAGPHDSFVRHSFAIRDGMQSLAELGFVVIQCDGMGTRNRSKAFHDVCWRNLKDAGFPDRIAWIKALGAKYPYVDTERVGIYGTSAGGQSSTGAMLFHPEFYKVAVSSCGCHDNRIDKRWWNEQWMGTPVGSWYAESSNIDNAHRLRGKLLLFVGELDSNVPPESTIRLTDALMKADKDFDFLIITGSDHTSGGAYGERRRRDYFVRHLLGIEPPDRNAPKPALATVTLQSRPLGEAGIAQADSGADTTIDFHNRTSAEIELFWLSGNGQRRSYGTVAPGKDRILHTYSGHSWLVADPKGKGIALFVGESNPGIAEIR